VVWSLILLFNIFIFIARVFILVLLCLVIIDLMYVFASAMLDIIGEMLPFFLIFLVQKLFVVFSSILGCYSWYQNIGYRFSAKFIV
jgi:hypothetical protein